MKFVIKILISVIIYSLAINAQEKNRITIQGKVIDKETKEPLENVNVFLNNTTIGTTTNNEGAFLIKNVPYGSYNIIFSYLGYEVESKNLDSYKPYTFEFDIKLEPKPINLNQVNVTSEVPEDWQDDLEEFTTIFIGETDNSKKTKILNPEVLNFVKKGRELKAYSDSVVKIENKALGYMLYIVLDSVVYTPNAKVLYKLYPRFKELSPASKDEEEEWKANRQITYLDSPRHFYYALVHKQLSEDYYSLRDISGNLISPDDLDITCDKDSNLYEFKYTGKLEVQSFFNQKNILTFYYPSVTIDKNGNIISYFYSVEINGYWANQRIADLLPRNYVYLGK